MGAAIPRMGMDALLKNLLELYIFGVFFKTYMQKYYYDKQLCRTRKMINGLFFFYDFLISSRLRSYAKFWRSHTSHWVPAPWYIENHIWKDIRFRSIALFPTVTSVKACGLE